VESGGSDTGTEQQCDNEEEKSARTHGTALGEEGGGARRSEAKRGQSV
jgi:hypothetical protein